MIKQALQVCYEFNGGNKEREVNGLLAAMKRFNLHQGTIITLDQQGHEGKIDFVPIANWLLEKDG